MDVNITNLFVSIDDKTVLKDFCLAIAKGEIHVIMGPNGVGKSTLSKVIMGDPNYLVKSGDITCDGNSILNLSTDLRAKLGIFLAFQNPTAIEGVTNSEFLRTALTNKNKDFDLYAFIKKLDKSCQELDFNKDFVHRAINVNFSGGEKKKNEILQLKMLEPKFLILDELDSGLDVDSLQIVCKNILNYKQEHPDTSILMITHYTRILEYLKPDYVHVLKDGKIIKTGPLELAYEIQEKGYKIFDHGTSKIDEVKNYE